MKASGHIGVDFLANPPHSLGRLLGSAHSGAVAQIYESSPRVAQIYESSPRRGVSHRCCKQSCSSLFIQYLMKLKMSKLVLNWFKIGEVYKISLKYI